MVCSTVTMTSAPCIWVFKLLVWTSEAEVVQNDDTMTSIYTH